MCIQRTWNELQSWNNSEKRSNYTEVNQILKSSLVISDLLNETKGFKYQIMLKVTLKKYKPNKEIEVKPVYFNSTAKAVINLT